MVALGDLSTDSSKVRDGNEIKPSNFATKPQANGGWSLLPVSDVHPLPKCVRRDFWWEICQGGEAMFRRPEQDCMVPLYIDQQLAIDVSQPTVANRVDLSSRLRNSRVGIAGPSPRSFVTAVGPPFAKKYWNSA
jgi:hypothetical protein